MTTPNFAAQSRLFASQLNAAFAQCQPLPATTPPISDSSTSVATTSYVNSSLNIVRPENFGFITGTVSPTQRLLNTTALTNCVAAAFAANADIQLGGFTYQIDGTFAVWATGVPSGVTVKGPFVRGIRFVTRVEQWNASGGIDTIRYGPPTGNALGQGLYGGGVQNLWIVSMIDQTSIAPLAGNLGAQLAIVGCEQCDFGGLAIGEVNQRIVDQNHFAYNAMAQDPSSGAFSCTFHDIEIKGFGNNGFVEYGTSGNVHWNIMVRNGGLGEPALKASTGYGFSINNAQGIWDQVNLEWALYSGYNVGGIIIASAASLHFGHLHIEGVQLQTPGGGDSAVIMCAGAGDVRFESLAAISLQFPSGPSSVALFDYGFSGYSQISIGQLIIAQTVSSAPPFYLLNSVSNISPNSQLDFAGPITLFADGSFGSKLTNWSNYQSATTNQGPASGLGVPPTNYCGRAILTITTSVPGYSAGVFTATMMDGTDLYQWNAGVNGTVVLPLTVLDAQLPVSIPPYPGSEKEIVNIDATHTCAVHDSAGTNLLAATNLTTGQFVRLRFDGAHWRQVNSGTRL